jgi:uncharacterized repeat protein (TIGR01451 family)
MYGPIVTNKKNMKKTMIVLLTILLLTSFIPLNVQSAIKQEIHPKQTTTSYYTIKSISEDQDSSIRQISIDDTRKDGVWINVTKELSPQIIHPCEPATIFINVSSEGISTVEYAPINVVMVIDRSGSMENIYDEHSALFWVKEAAKGFVGELNFSKDKVGIISYGTQVTLEQPLTDDGEIANSSIDSITIDQTNWERGTNTGEGLRIAQQHLIGNLTEGAIPIIILFSDGCPSIHGIGEDINHGNIYDHFCGNCPTDNNTCVAYAREHADEVKNNGITIFTAGFFEGICDTCNNCAEVQDYARWLSKDMASDPMFFFDAPTSNDIEGIFLDISQHVEEIIITDLIVTDYLPEDIIVLTTGGGTYTLLENGTQKVEFTLGALPLNTTWSNSFTITTDFVGDEIVTNLPYSRFTYTKNTTQYIDILPYPITLNATPPITLTKMGPSESAPGEILNYTIIVENTGHLSLNNLVLQDILPQKVTFTPVESNIQSDFTGFNESNWDYYDLNHTINIHDLSLPIGQTIHVNLSVLVNADATGSIINEVIAGYSTDEIQCDSFGFCSTTTSTDITNGTASIDIKKTVEPTQVFPLSNITYTITVTNDGDCLLDPVIVTDLLPSTITYLSSIPSGVEGPQGTITWNLGAIDVDETRTISLVCSVDMDATGIQTNLVTVSGTSIYDYDVFDNDTADITVLPPVEVVKSVHYNCNGPWDDEGIIIDMNEIHYDWCTFRINITNLIDVPLNVTVTDILPNGLFNGNHYYPFYPDGGDDHTIIWYLDGIHHDLLYPDQTMTFGVRGEMGNCDTTYVNHVYVSSKYGCSVTRIDTDSAFVRWENCSEILSINQSIFDRGFPIRHTMDGEWAAAQNFTPGTSMITSAGLLLRTFGSPEFDLTVELREGGINGPLKDSVTVNSGEIVSDWQWITIDFNDVNVSCGEEYFIICPPAPSSVTTSFGYEWGYAFGDQYPDGAFWFTRDSGSTWHDLPTMYDFAFRIYGKN